MNAPTKTEDAFHERSTATPYGLWEIASQMTAHPRPDAWRTCGSGRSSSKS